MSQDICFRFPDQDTANSIMPCQSFANMDQVGFIYDQNGVLGTDWCLNICLLDNEIVSDSQKVYQIPYPLYPKRVWYRI